MKVQCTSDSRFFVLLRLHSQREIYASGMSIFGDLVFWTCTSGFFAAFVFVPLGDAVQNCFRGMHWCFCSDVFARSDEEVL